MVKVPLGGLPAPSWGQESLHDRAAVILVSWGWVLEIVDLSHSLNTFKYLTLYRVSVFVACLAESGSGVSWTCDEHSDLCHRTVISA